jgi:DNA polymerase-3 subunit delta'
MPFSEVMAQPLATGALRAALRRGILHHAYLFGGPPGVGKGTAARLVAQAANCQGGVAGPAGLREDPCGACPPCRKIAHATHPDVIALAEEREMVRRGTWEAEGGRSPSREIVVAQIRDLVDRRLALRRFEGRRRVVVIDPAEAMNAQAQNALLKTLEEPPEGTTLILVSSSPDALLPTIRSRCLRITFGPLPDALVAEALVRRGRSPEEARGAAALAGGSLARAEALAGDEVAAVTTSLRAVAALRPDAPLGWLAFARSLGRTTAKGEEAEDGSDREQVAEVGQALLAWWRDVLAVQAGSDRLALPDLAEATHRTAAALAPAEALRRRAGVERLLAGLRQNAAGPLALERLLIGWFDGR